MHVCGGRLYEKQRRRLEVLSFKVELVKKGFGSAANTEFIRFYAVPRSGTLDPAEGGKPKTRSPEK